MQLNNLLREYAKSHSHPKNVFIHNIFIPLIMFSLLGMLMAIPLPYSVEGSTQFFFLNFSALFMYGCLVYYWRLSKKLFWGMLVLAILMLGINFIFREHSLFLATNFIIFAVSWVFQIWGHKIEGKKPKFADDLVYFLIGPLWVVKKIYKKIGLQ